ncbi:MAG: NAD(P)/FAD-dependent oxidoreductase [Proteobacteria bacterium]|nr:NAD(P)/FAD-dependent oxidoreductase [Pseudomonadota bacterium]
MRVVVIGAGVNGLVAAIRLARAGRLVTVVERRDLFGGIAAGEEFHTDYHHIGLTHDSAEVRGEVIKQLGLQGGYGLQLRPPAPLFIAEPDGRGLVLEEQGSELAERSIEAAEGLARWELLQEAFRPAVRMVLREEAPDVRQEAALLPLLKKGWMVRGIGEDHLLELLRIGPLCVDDWMEEFVEDPLIRTAVLWPALVGAWMGPRSPYSATNLLMDAASHEYEIIGGPAALVKSLLLAAADAGVSLRSATEAKAIQVSDGRATGVILADGEVLKGQVLVASAPSTLLDLIPAWKLPSRLVRDLTNVRVRGTTAKLHLALSGELQVAARGETFERMLLGASHPMDLERAFDDVKHRRLPRRPWLDVRLLTGDSAPEGHSVASIMVHCAPYDLDGGWTDEARAEFTERVMAVLEESCPGVRELVVHSELLTPPDLEERYGLPGGHLFHGERMVDQFYVMRPSLHLSRHTTDLPGLFVGSMGTHSGGGVTGGPGMLAAERMIATPR